MTTKETTNRMKLAAGQWMLTIVVCCAMMMTGLTSCSDEDDNGEAQSSAVDNGAWMLSEDEMDASVKPGDDFFMYCNGGFWQRTEVVETGGVQGWLISETVPQMLEQRVNALNIPSLEKMKSDAAKRDDETITMQQERLQAVMARIEAVTTREEVWQLVGELMKEGYHMPLSMDLLTRNGRVGAYLKIEGEEDDIVAMFNGEDNISRHLLNDPTLMACARPLQGDGTRSIDSGKWPMLTTVFETLGIAPEYAYTVDCNPTLGSEMVTLYTMYLNMLQNYDVDEWKNNILPDYINADAVFFSDERLEAMNARRGTAMTREDVVNNFANKNLRYEKSKVFADTYVTTEMKQRTKDVCDQIRETFRQRIARNEWMSDASKQKVLEKLDAMAFNVGFPDEWFDEGMPDLSKDPSLLDDVLAVRRAKFNLNRLLVGMETPRASFHHLINNFYDLSFNNAFYLLDFNAMNIYPTWLMDPLVDPKANEAHYYAVYTVVGHEITHGFDRNGAGYNKLGDQEDIWANESDHQEFLRRAQMIVDCFNDMEVMPWALPGLCNDGAYTADENIADLGGFLLAYETYVRHLRDSGFTGKQLDLQRQRFYLAVGKFWQGKYSATYARLRTTGEGEKINGKGKDEHSLPRERVNGMVMNTDDWYELFPVETTDKYYRAPDDRIRIW